ncbi:hemerythrin family protein [Sulfurimonas sp. MAG313]|nr:hemerythrin family protein [Sulfurimonas sp. MAG313]MDF1880031.1 hemerythrin family protein [Sulfurimonas sp. MAG313]
MITQDQLPMLAIPSMNDNHLEEILLIHKLDKVARANDIKAVAEVLREYVDHSIKHFADEEKLMREADFPDYLTHKGEHDRHIKEMGALIKYFDKNQDPRAIYVHIEGGLSPWILHHMQTMDSDAAEFLK